MHGASSVALTASVSKGCPFIVQEFIFCCFFYLDYSKNRFCFLFKHTSQTQPLIHVSISQANVTQQ